MSGFNWKEKLQEMVDGYDNQVASLRSQVGTLRDKAADLEQQNKALAHVESSQRNSLNGILQKKADNASSYYGGTFTIYFGETNLVGNLTDWYIYYHGDAPGYPDPGIYYKYEGINWDGNLVIICLINEFNFIYDYRYAPVNENLYSLTGLFEMIDSGISKLEDMITKFEQAKVALERFAKTGLSRCLIDPTIF